MRHGRPPPSRNPKPGFGSRRTCGDPDNLLGRNWGAKLNGVLDDTPRLRGKLRTEQQPAGNRPSDCGVRRGLGLGQELGGLFHRLGHALLRLYLGGLAAVDCAHRTNKKR
jgi:hypothetical protein